MEAAAGSLLRQFATASAYATPRSSVLRPLERLSGIRPTQWQCNLRVRARWSPFISTRWIADSSKPGISGIERTVDSSGKAQGSSSTLEARLPSESVSRRHALSARMSQTTDRLLASLATTSQRVNEYTGTDYTGIASLRSDIRALESTAKDLLTKVGDAKAAHDAAVAAQGASQKEVVQLLERKHSWADGDLERYMALIRNEHEHDAAVKSARDALRALEHELEDTRGQLERKERRQYHEEQVWSDTIRRNSTWVTFGLMGFNVFLLLANVVIIEPWRRRRLVHELKSEMDDRMVPAPDSSPVDAAILQDIDGAMPGAEVTNPGFQIVTVGTDEHAGNLLGHDGLPPKSLPAPHGYAALIKIYLGDLFSDRTVMLRKLDITTIAVESAAAGAALVGLFVFWFRIS